MNSTVSKGTVKEFFIYLGLALALNIFLASLVFLCFGHIELFLPPVNDGDYRGYTLDKIRWNLSVMVIMFPVLAFLSYLASKEIKGDSSKINTRSRTWFLYSALFVTGASGTLDLVYLVNNFLNGDLAKTFLLKALSVLVVAIVTFVYYYRELSRYRHLDYVTAGTSIRIQTVFGNSVVAAMVVVLVGSFYVVGTPGSQRRQRQDENRLETLVYLRDIVDSYYQKEANLPKDLRELNQKRPDSISVSKDPETGEDYEYRIINSNTFELCGNFGTDRDPSEVGKRYGSGLSYKPGRNCFSHTAEEVTK